MNDETSESIVVVSASIGHESNNSEGDTIRVVKFLLLFLFMF